LIWSRVLSDSLLSSKSSTTMNHDKEERSCLFVFNWIDTENKESKFYFIVFSNKIRLTREHSQVSPPISMNFCLYILYSALVKTLNGFELIVLFSGVMAILLDFRPYGSNMPVKLNDLVLIWKFHDSIRTIIPMY